MNRPTNPKEWMWTAVQGATAFLVLAFFLFQLRPVLSPFILFLLLVAVLLPFRGVPGHSLVLSVAALLVLFWILDTTGFLLAPFVLALVLAYVLDPAVDRIEERGLDRSIGIGLLALPVAAVLAVGVFVGLPALGQQVGEVIDRAPELLNRFATWLESLDQRVEALSLPDFALGMVERIRSVELETVVAFLQERQAEIVRRLWAGVVGLGQGIGSTLSVLGYVVLTPVLTFYLLRDWDRLVAGMVDLVPHERRDAVVGFFSEYDDLLSRYLRGQVTVALIVGAITAVGLWVTGFPFAFLIGVIVAVFGVVPYLGLVLSLLPAIAVALVSGAVVPNLIKMAVVYAVAQGLEGSVISPRIVGESVGLHPVWVVLALSIGGFYFGFVGLLIGVPLAVGVKLLVIRLLARYRASDLYAPGGGGEASSA